MSKCTIRTILQAACAVSTLFIAATAGAQSAFFERPLFTAALGTTQTNDLNALANGSTVLSFGSLGTATLSGATVNSGRINNPASPYTFSITFSQLINGFGADVFNSSGSGGNAGFRFFNGASMLHETALYSFIFPFKGVTLPGAGFNRVEITEVPIPGNGAPLFSSLDNLTVGVLAGPSTTVPEPSTWALLGSGLVALGVAARRKRKL